MTLNKEHLDLDFCESWLWCMLFCNNIDLDYMSLISDDASDLLLSVTWHFFYITLNLWTRVHWTLRFGSRCVYFRARQRPHCVRSPAQALHHLGCVFLKIRHVPAADVVTRSLPKEARLDADRVQYASGDSSSENSALTLICFLRFHLWWLNHLFHLQQLVQKARRGHGVKSVSESLKHKLNHLLTLLLTVIWYGIYGYFSNMRNHSWCTVCIKICQILLTYSCNTWGGGQVSRGLFSCYMFVARGFTV